MLTGKCPFCDENAKKIHAACPQPDIDMLFCRTCRLAFQNPFVDSARLHDREYFASWGDEAAVEEMKRIDFQAKLNLLEKHQQLPGKNLLDIGAAQGHFMAVARESGWSVTGIEMSTAGLGSAPDDPDIVRADFLKHDFSGKTFSAVTSFSVIEHVSDPRAFIGKVLSLLEPQGIWLVMTPDYESLGRRLLGRRWPHFNPLHTVIFSSSFFENISSGFSIECLRVSRAENSYFLSYLLGQLAFNGGLFSTRAAKLIRMILPGFILKKRIRLAGGNLLAVLRKS